MSSNIIEIILFLTLGGVSGSYLTYFLNEKSKKESRDYNIKVGIYSELSRVLKEFESDQINEDACVKEIHKILSKAYMVAPDKVILGIKKIWEDKSGNKLKGENITSLILNLRRDIISNTKLTNEDYFYLMIPKE